EEQPTRRPRTLGRARRYRARSPAHSTELLRPQGRHRRAGLRPLAQPLQGSGARGGRTSPAEGDPRRAGEAGGGDPAWVEGAGGNARVMAAIHLAQLKDVADINPSLDAPLADDDDVSFLPMSAVDADNVDAVDAETRRFREVSKGYTPFRVDDVLVAKITPCFENGKIEQAKLTRGIGFGSTEFHVIRPHRSKLDARYLVHFLRQERIRKEGERKMTGSAGQRRVPEHFLANLPIPL